MKKLISICILKIILLTTGYAQNSIKAKWVIPFHNSSIPLTKPYTSFKKFSFNSFVLSDEKNNDLYAFLNNQPLLKVQIFPGNAFLLFAELSFTDMMENTINSVDASLLNKYDDHITELFRDAPSIFKLKCTIEF